MRHKPSPVPVPRALPAPLSSATGKTDQGEGRELGPKALPQRARAVGLTVPPREHPLFAPGIFIVIIKSFSSLTVMQLNPSITSYTLKPGPVFFDYLPKIRDELISV